MRYLSFSLLVLLFIGCSPNNVDTDNSLETYFKQNHSEGCFTLFNNSNGRFTIYNLPRYRDSTFMPVGTFDLMDALIGLQTGVITNDSMVIKWDGRDRGVPEWNKDLSLHQALQVSALPYFQEVARRLGKDTMQLWLDSVKYGNMKIGGVLDSFWLNNSLKLTPDEEMGFAKRLFFNQLPFFKNNQEAVKEGMLMEDKPTYRLSYHAGMARKMDGSNMATVVGWVQENQHPYFFILNMETKDPNVDLKTVRITVLKQILNHLGYMQGKK
ncbi:MAG: penicillin-binding transpeptidase domain-containing protein [Candidatus Dadabacteria bacterium]